MRSVAIDRCRRAAILAPLGPMNRVIVYVQEVLIVLPIAWHSTKNSTFGLLTLALWVGLEWELPLTHHPLAERGRSRARLLIAVGLTTERGFRLPTKEFCQCPFIRALPAAFASLASLRAPTGRGS